MASAMKSRENRETRSSWRGKVLEKDLPKDNAVEKCQSEVDSKDVQHPIEQLK